ncbi:MAG: ATP-binding protein [Candidatus Aenigmarchaeota archaeon]|nr:ATP-binding protein [Candidatus Aenigmarchaeota archaeon]
MTQIKEILQDLNPWWKEDFKLDFKNREIYAQIQKYMPMPQIIAITGLRRVGKTTIMRKIAEDKIKEGFDPKSIIYFSFDDFRNTDIRQIMKEYEEMTEKNLRDGNYLLLLDEIQKLSNWEDKIKSIYDIFSKNIKIIISGSESLFIKKKSKETLAGRIFEFKVEPLSFREFLDFKDVNYTPVGLYEKELLKLFNEFILTCGFPELIEIKEKEIIKKYTKESIVEKIIYQDIPALFGVRDVSVLDSLLNILMENPGQLVDFTDMSKDMNISRQSLSNYMTYLEQSFLIRKVYNFSPNKRKTERKLKKYYPVFSCTDILFKEDTMSKSQVFESVIINQLKAEYFWRDSYKNEVDIILSGEKPIPIEIKYGKINTKGLMAFMKKYNIDEGFILSYKTEEKRIIDGKTINIVPGYKYLLKEQIQ